MSHKQCKQLLTQDNVLGKMWQLSRGAWEGRVLRNSSHMDGYCEVDHHYACLYEPQTLKWLSLGNGTWLL